MTVSDTGPGIPPESQSEVFHTFTQLRTDLPESQKGLGLGLSIVSSLVELMGGTIELESAGTQNPSFSGSLFIVNLPVEKASMEHITPQRSGAELPKHQFLKVLVAEDNEVNQILIQTILEQENYEVKIAENGENAVEMAASNYFDFILMDVQMPGMNGYEATRKIRKWNPDIPIIALSANAYEEDIQKSLEAGMNAHLNKPLKLKDLSAHIRALIPKLSAGKV